MKAEGDSVTSVRFAISTPNPSLAPNTLEDQMARVGKGIAFLRIHCSKRGEHRHVYGSSSRMARTPHHQLRLVVIFKGERAGAELDGRQSIQVCDSPFAQSRTLKRHTRTLREGVSAEEERSQLRQVEPSPPPHTPTLQLQIRLAEAAVLVRQLAHRQHLQTVHLLHYTLRE